MKIKVYIVTYKRNDVLNENLRTMFAGADSLDDIDVTILANHPEIEIDEENKKNFGDKLRVVMNTTRMPHAWGYLSRDWNFCILDAFRTWKNPNNVDWLVLSQNDVKWKKGWDTWIRNNKDYDFISQPVGDAVLALNIEAIKRVGFFDERFTTIQFHELDYFIRAIKYMPNRCSITTDPAHNQQYNPIGNVLIEEELSAYAVFAEKIAKGEHVDPTLHNGYDWIFTKSLLENKCGRPILSETFATLIVDCAKDPRYRGGEINWYPFFWEGYPEIEKTFVYSRLFEENEKMDVGIKGKKKTKLYKILHFYWLRGKK